MYRNIVKMLFINLALASSVLAQTPTPTEFSVGQRFFAMMPMFFMVFMIFFFLVHLPQKKQAKLQEDLLASLKKGVVVTTTGGIRAKIAAVEQDTVLLEVSNGVKLKVEKQHIKSKVS